MNTKIEKENMHVLFIIYACGFYSRLHHIVIFLSRSDCRSGRWPHGRRENNHSVLYSRLDGHTGARIILKKCHPLSQPPIWISEIEILLTITFLSVDRKNC